MFHYRQIRVVNHLREGNIERAEDLLASAQSAHRFDPANSYLKGQLEEMKGNPIRARNAYYRVMKMTRETTDERSLEIRRLASSSLTRLLD